MRKIALLSAALFATLALGSGPLGAGGAFAQNNCEFGERIDGTTAIDAKRKLEAAGLINVRNLRKGCDNYWHAIATYDGVDIGVVLSPQGAIIRETG